MGTPRFTPEFKEEAVRQITERGYSVAEESDRLDVSAHSLYKWLPGCRHKITAHYWVWMLMSAPLRTLLPTGQASHSPH